MSIQGVKIAIPELPEVIPEVENIKNLEIDDIWKKKQKVKKNRKKPEPTLRKYRYRYITKKMLPT